MLTAFLAFVTVGLMTIMRLSNGMLRRILSWWTLAALWFFALDSFVPLTRYPLAFDVSVVASTTSMVLVVLDCAKLVPLALDKLKAKQPVSPPTLFVRIATVTSIIVAIIILRLHHG